MHATDFPLWTLDKQKEFLQQRLTSETLGELLVLCGDLPDTTPLVFLVQEALKRDIPLGERAADTLLTLPTSTLHKLLHLPGLETPVAAAWSKAGLEQLVSFAVLDRYLRRRAPRIWQQKLEENATLAEAALKAGNPPTEAILLRLNGEQQRTLQSRYPEEWSNLWQELGLRAISILATRPRGVSLANAEKLLSQQVYTDQGHFLLELLQNADDSGATYFQVQFKATEIVVTHNGTPFDFRDLVGVLSIGQTTKTERQIGYFGVGFKSVFEVTDRPVIHSGFFSFEIIDISIPRAITPEHSQEVTKLIFPLKEELDVTPYYRRALQIESTLLLNLPNIESLTWIGPAGETTRLSRRSAGDFQRLTHGKETRNFKVWRGLYHHTGERPEGKPRKAEIMLAFPQEKDSESEHGRLFSFLPIQERSGLRFLIGSHFDVPVDRERLDQNSLWNRGIINTIPDLIEEEVKREPTQLSQLLTRFPLPEDPVGPLFRTLSESLKEKLAEIPFLPSSQDSLLLKASEVSVLDEELHFLFTEEERDPFALPVDERERRWLIELGATPYDLKCLLKDFVAGKFPSRLLAPHREAWSNLHKMLLNSPQFESWEGQLNKVPLFPDNQGRIARASELVKLEEGWEEIFAQAPRTLWNTLRTSPETHTLLAALEIRVFDWSDLLEHLKEYSLDKVHFHKLVPHLEEAPKGIQFKFFRLPLFRDRKGDLQPITIPSFPDRGVLITDSTTPMELFPDLEFLPEGEILTPLVESSNWPTFDRSEALSHLLARDWHPDSEEIDTFCRWMLECESDWATMEDLEKLSRLPIFQTEDGEKLPLRSIWLYEEPEISRFLPALPRLKEGGASQQLVKHFDLEHRLGRADLCTLIEKFDPGRSLEVLNYLSPRAHQLSRESISQLFSRPLVDDRPVTHPDREDLHNPVEVAELDLVDLFLALEQPVVSRTLSEKLLPLMEAAGYKPLGLQRLLDVLREQSPPPELVPDLQELFVARRKELQETFSESVLRSIPIRLCRDGRVRSTKEIPPTEELAQLLHLEGARPAETQHPELQKVLPLLEEQEFLVEKMKREVLPSAALELQPEWFDSVEKVDRVALRLSKFVLCVDAQGRVRDKKLLYAPKESHAWLSHTDLWPETLHPESSEEQIQRAIPVPAHELLERAVPRLEDRNIRAGFYQYLLSHLDSVNRDYQAVEMLLSQPIWKSAGGRWRRLEEFILEPGFPKLDFDWYPASEIPEELLQRLKSTLSLEHQDPRTLVEILIPTYKECLTRGRPTDQLLGLLSQVTESLSSEECVRLFAPHFPDGQFRLEGESYSRPINEFYAPPSDYEPLGSCPPVAEKHTTFLRKLGLPHLPPPYRLNRTATLGAEDAERLAKLVHWVAEERPRELEARLPDLQSLSWMPDRAKSLRAPVQLYLPTPEIEDLIGTSESQFPALEWPTALFRKLGLKSESDLELPLLFTHLRRCVEHRTKVSGRFYRFLENELMLGKVNPQFVVSQLNRLPWVWSDEGVYRHHQEMICRPAYRYFGAYRGSWEHAEQRYPTLVELFEIPVQVTPQAVKKFLEEIHQGHHPECPFRLLVNGLAFLGEREQDFPSHWKVVPAHAIPGLEETLVSPDDPKLFQSNSPTLAALFGQGGSFWVVDSDHPEHGENLSLLYERLEIPRLRNSYTVAPDTGGTDVTAEYGEELRRFRRLLLALYKLLPRLRAARPEWEEGDWLDEQQLRPFAQTASVRVLDNLTLLYDLPRISTVKVSASLAYDPEKERLLVSSAAVGDPRRHALELSEGLVECIYQGPNSESMIDLLNLLILLGEEKIMNQYLDQRHFPRPFDETSIITEPWRLRLAEVLDFDLHKILERRFPELKGARWERWRDSSWYPERVEPITFLNQIGIENPSQELQAVIKELLESPQASLPETGQGTPPETSAPAQLVVSEENRPPEQEPSRLTNFKERLLTKLKKIVRTEATPSQTVGLQSSGGDLSEHYRHPPDRHILFSETSLSGHNLYCLEHACDRFDSESQEYLTGDIRVEQLFLPSGKTVQFSGRLTLPALPLPMPLHSRLISPPSFPLQEPDRFGLYRLSGSGTDQPMEYTVELSALPELQGVDTQLSYPSTLLEQTALPQQLPSRTRDWIDWARRSGLPHWQLCERAKEYVESAYRYDLNWGTHPGVVELKKRPPGPRENRFLTLLHAGAEGRVEGRGVCVELSALLLEILRRCDIPCLLARVWMLDQGLIHLPDHMIVLALVPSSAGPYWLPLDPSVQRLAGAEEAEQIQTRQELLEKAAELLLHSNLPVPERREQRQRFLEEELLRSLGSEELLEVFLDCLARPDRYHKELTSELLELEMMGLIRLKGATLYQVEPTSSLLRG